MPVLIFLYYEEQVRNDFLIGIKIDRHFPFDRFSHLEHPCAKSRLLVVEHWLVFVLFSCIFTTQCVCLVLRLLFKELGKVDTHVHFTMFTAFRACH